MDNNSSQKITHNIDLNLESVFSFEKSVSHDKFINLSKDDIKAFFKVLGIDFFIITKTNSTAQEKLTYLNTLISACLSTIPWHNSTLLTRERRPPTPEEIIHDCTSGIGGPCSVVNTFFAFFLSNIGFSTWIVPSTIHQPKCHVTIIVNILKSYFFVDVANSAGYFRAVDIFDESTHTFGDFQYFLSIKISQKNHIELHHKHFNKATQKVSSQLAQTIDLEPVFFSSFQKMIKTTRSNTTFSPFLLHLRCSIFRNNIRIRLKDGILEQGYKKTRKIQNLEELYSLATEYFPPPVVTLVMDSAKLLNLNLN